MSQFVLKIENSLSGGIGKVEKYQTTEENEQNCEKIGCISQLCNV